MGILRHLFFTLMKWNLVGALLGLVAALIYREHPSIALIYLSIIVSIIGALADITLFFIERKLSTALRYRWLLIGCFSGLLSVLLLCGALQINIRDITTTQAFQRLLLVFAGIAPTVTSLLITKADGCLKN